MAFNKIVVIFKFYVTNQTTLCIIYHTGHDARSTASDTSTSAPPIDEADQVAITVSIWGPDGSCRRPDVLPGDVKDEGVGNRQDLTAIRNASQGNGSARSSIFADALDKDAVSGGGLAAAKIGHDTRLRRLRVEHPEAILSRPDVSPSRHETTLILPHRVRPWHVA
jgi:hypothetical protein